MDIDSPVKSIRSIRHLRHGDSGLPSEHGDVCCSATCFDVEVGCAERTHKSLNTSRHRGKEKGTVIWRVQPEMGDLVVREKETASCDPSLSLEQAVKTAKPGARIFVQGEHSWTGTLVLDKRVQVRSVPNCSANPLLNTSSRADRGSGGMGHNLKWAMASPGQRYRRLVTQYWLATDLV
eukprot:3799511-Rhodomonas_salina.1